MAHLYSSHNFNIVVTITFVSLLAVPVVGPAMPVVQENFGISNRDIGWMVMSAFSLPALLFVPLCGYFADRYGKRAVLLPTMVLFSVSGGTISLAPNPETIIALRFLQGIGASSIATLNTALVPDLFTGRDRVTVMGSTAVVQGLGSGVLPLLGGLLALVTWYLPFMTALIGLPIAFYVYMYLKNTKPKTEGRKGSYMAYAWTNLADRRVMELCFFTFGFIFVGFGAFVSYIPSYMATSFGAGSLIIGIVVSARAFSGTLSAAFLNRLTLKFSSRTLMVLSFVLLGAGMISVPLSSGPFGIIIAAFCYGASFGITRPLVQVHLFEIAPKDLRSTFSSANGVAVRLGQTLAPFGAGLIITGISFDAMYFIAGAIAFMMMTVALFGTSLSKENTRVG